MDDASHPSRPAPYRVLARKYRPQSFDELIGQDALVRTLRNAIQSGRIHQAYMLTGVRGVGKTTTARIIARALNCIGPDGQGGPTVSPCGACEMCISIAADRNVDVIEMDAASNTGVDHVREIIDSVRYAPAAARYKLYIIDEVHMLSKSAFNALLKTLEEPPPHVKFVFATTEIRKVPVTVLSRCQRFDLRRVDHAILMAHFVKVAALEQVEAETEALAQIARAADGSVRDGLSLLDQAIALGNGKVSLAHVRDMLGLADRTRMIDLLEASLSGTPALALDILDDLHKRGADPLVILHDLLDFAHFLTRARVIGGIADDPSIPEDERTKGVALAARLGMPALARAWQILLKGLAEVQHAPVPSQALEMMIIRLAYASTLPSPGDLVRQIVESGGDHPGKGSDTRTERNGGERATALSERPIAARTSAWPQHDSPGNAPSGGPAKGQALALAPAPVAESATALAPPGDFLALVRMLQEGKEGLLAGYLHSAAHLVHYEPGRVELRLAPSVPANVPGRVGQLLSQWTGMRWIISLSGEIGAPTLAEQEAGMRDSARQEALRHPFVQAVFALFPGAKLESVRDLSLPAPAPLPLEGLSGMRLHPAPGSLADDDGFHDDDFDLSSILDGSDEEGDF
jgi:DNA polymerase III subunit gamma/tau